MIFTVFPKDDKYLPQDFGTFEEAIEYANELDCGSTVEETTGEPA